MDSASPKTPTKRASWFGSVKSRLSPSKSITGDENASPKGSGSKKSVRRRFADSIRLHISKGEKEQQDTIIERPRTTLPCKSSRISGDKHVSKRKSLSSLFTRSIGSYKTRGSNEFGPPPYVVSLCEARGSHESGTPLQIINSCEMSDSYESRCPFHVIDSSEVKDSNESCASPQTIDSRHMSNPQPEKSSHEPSSETGIRINSTIESIVANMTDNRYFYPPKFWETVSAGEGLLRKPKPYRSLRDIPSKDDLSSSDLDRYLEESIALRTPRQPRPSSQKLRHVSTAAVRVKLPMSGHTAVYASREKAIADLYEKSNQLADYAIWDPVSRIIEAFPTGQEVFPALTGIGADATQYIWLPINSWPGPKNQPTNPPTAVRSSDDELFKENGALENSFIDDEGSLEKDSFRDNEPFQNSPTDEDGSLENDSLKETNRFEKSSVDEGYGSLELELFKAYESLKDSPEGTECKAPPPSPHNPENESSLAELSADEFGLDFEIDSNIDEVFCEGESLQKSKLSARRVRIEDIVRPESVGSSWYIPNDESRVGSPAPTWKDLKQKRKPAEGRSLSQASTALESSESNGRLNDGMSACEVAMAAVAKDAFNIDTKVWDGYQWIEVLACGMASDNYDLSDLGDIQVVAAVDHVEHVSAPTDLETYFQPGEILQTGRTIEDGREGACPYALLCCHFHDSSGRPLTLRCPDLAIMDSSCCHNHETKKLFVDEKLGDYIIRVSRELCPSQMLSGNEPSAEEALSIRDEVLQTTAVQDAEENVAEYESFIEKDSLGDCIIRVFRGLAPLQMFSENELSAEEFLSILDEVLQTTAAQDAEENIAESLRLTEEFEERRASNASWSPGFKFSLYGDILEEELNLSPNEDTPDCTAVLKTVDHSHGENDLERTTVLEKVDRSPGEDDCNHTALAVLEDLNIRLVGKAATPRKNVRALVDIFQSRDLMPQTPPILQSNSRIATPPPRFQRSNGSASEQATEILNVRDFVHDWGKPRPGSVASNADTDVSSRFGEALERFGGVAFEYKENH